MDYKGTCFLAESSVGLVNATQAVSKIIAQYDITHVFSAGTAGGMGENIRIGVLFVGRIILIMGLMPKFLVMN